MADEQLIEVSEQKKPAKETDEVDLTPAANIRLRDGMEPIGEGKLAGGVTELFIPNAAMQKKGWYSPNAGLLKDMYKQHYQPVIYDENGKETPCDNC